MPDPLSYVAVGQKALRPSAERHNAFVEAAKYVKTKTDRPRDLNGSGYLSQITIDVVNTTDTMIDAGGVVGLGDPIFIPVDDKPIPEISFEVVAPTAEHVAKRQIAILAEPANPSGGLAKAYVDGWFPAKVNFSSDDTNYAVVDPDGEGSDGLLSKGGVGDYRIVWRPSDPDTSDFLTGEQWAIVTPIERVPFVVWLTKDGGDDGDSSTAATWTYTIKTIEGVELDTAIELVRARPIGQMDYAPANSRGLAVYEDGDDGIELILLDAYGEKPGAEEACT
jgi:hypothetical protein